MNKPSALSTRIKNLRAQSGLSQAAFAKRLHVSRGLYNGWETGREDPPDWFIQQLNMLEVLGVEILHTDEFRVGAPNQYVQTYLTPSGGVTERVEESIRGPINPEDLERPWKEAAKGIWHAGQMAAGHGMPSGLREAVEMAQEILKRYRDASPDRDKIGWLNVELRRLLDTAPFPRKKNEDHNRSA